MTINRLVESLKEKQSVDVSLITEKVDDRVEFYLKADGEKFRIHGPIMQGNPTIGAKTAINGEYAIEMSNLMRVTCPYIEQNEAEKTLDLFVENVKTLISEGINITKVGNYSREDFQKNYSSHKNTE